MLSYLLGPFGLIIHAALIVLVVYLLRRERFAWWASILLGIFTEFGLIVAGIQAVAYVLDGRQWDGGPYPAHDDFANTF